MKFHLSVPTNAFVITITCLLGGLIILLEFIYIYYERTNCAIGRKIKLLLPSFSTFSPGGRIRTNMYINKPRKNSGEKAI